MWWDEACESLAVDPVVKSKVSLALGICSYDSGHRRWGLDFRPFNVLLCSAQPADLSTCSCILGHLYYLSHFFVEALFQFILVWGPLMALLRLAFGSTFSDHSWQGTEDHMGYWGVSPSHSCAKPMPYLIYYHPSPYGSSHCMMRVIHRLGYSDCPFGGVGL